MKIGGVIYELEKIEVKNSEDYENLDQLERLCGQIVELENGQLACQVLIKLLERHPEIEFGSPGAPVHTLEKFIGHYESHLYESLQRRPTELTVWMLNRILNGKEDNDKGELLELMEQCSRHEVANEQTRKSAIEFIDFQKSN